MSRTTTIPVSVASVDDAAVSAALKRAIASVLASGSNSGSSIGGSAGSGGTTQPRLQLRGESAPSSAAPQAGGSNSAVSAAEAARRHWARNPTQSGSSQTSQKESESKACFKDIVSGWNTKANSTNYKRPERPGREIAPLIPTAAEVDTGLNPYFGNEKSSKADGTFNTHMAFMRHQQGENNTNPYYCPPDAKLTSFGMQKAVLAAMAYHNRIMEGTDTIPDVVMASPLDRTMQTTQPIIEILKLLDPSKDPLVFVAPGLREQGGCYGTNVEPGKQYEGATILNGHEMLNRTDTWNSARDGGETDYEMDSRAEAFIEDGVKALAAGIHERTGKKDVHVFCTTHANFARHLGKALDGDMMRLTNGQINTYDLETRDGQASSQATRSSRGNYIDLRQGEMKKEDFDTIVKKWRDQWGYTKPLEDWVEYKDTAAPPGSEYGGGINPAALQAALAGMKSRGGRSRL